jgi:outer membrane lipoprotein-sorting protein
MRFFRISFLFIALLTALVLVSCSNSENNKVAENTSAGLDLVKDGATSFTIIRPELDDNEATVEQMKAIRDSF